MATALVCIDMQMGMAERIAAGREQANPQVEAHVAALLALFRAKGWPVVHVHHDEEGTPFRRGLPAGAAMPCALPLAGEAVLWKSRSSAFAGTGLEALLRGAGVGRIVVIGAVAAFCVTSTVRAASDLGFEVVLPGDALLAFDLPAHDGGRLGADVVLRVTLSLLGADFARLVTADQVEGVLAA
ncbi:cysteine hydrolase family protein [Paragemmobacter straminiformis]|uniref:Cysteine hydrolase n=1 Tax=Paragemmobacter straminiformis TaxID=2045119 RepID=A0A842I5M1_9RHOB|nr:cysteine hydrolase family protein [Gemmobacter straminiformis]MBC2834258.1 cysteine hydrolase [Gemmobacter straminiformis]